MPDIFDYTHTSSYLADWRAVHLGGPTPPSYADLAELWCGDRSRAGQLHKVLNGRAQVPIGRADALARRVLALAGARAEYFRMLVFRESRSSETEDDRRVLTEIDRQLAALRWLPERGPDATRGDVPDTDRVRHATYNIPVHQRYLQSVVRLASASGQARAAEAVEQLLRVEAAEDRVRPGVDPSHAGRRRRYTLYIQLTQVTETQP